MTDSLTPSQAIRDAAAARFIARCQAVKNAAPPGWRPRNHAGRASRRARRSVSNDEINGRTGQRHGAWESERELHRAYTGEMYAVRQSFDIGRTGGSRAE